MKKITKAEFARETGLIDDVLDQAWSDYRKANKPTFWRWWADNQGNYV